MDDATRTELAGLRRRAYSPGADIGGDPAAQSRLDELEELARQERAASAPVAEVRVDTAAPALDARARPTASVLESAATTAPPFTLRRRPLWHSASIAAVALVALLLAAPQLWPREEPAAVAVGVALKENTGFELTSTDLEHMLLRVPLDGYFDSRLQLPEAGEALVAGDHSLQWARPLGRYFGWRITIARAETGEACLLIERSEERKSECLSTAAQSQGLLSVDVSYYEVPWLDRPLQMGPGQSIAFRWLPDDSVTIQLVPTV